MNNHFLRALAVGFLSLGSTAVAQPALDLELKSAELTPPFVLTNDCICQSSETQVTNGGRAIFRFKVSEAGDYVVSPKIQRGTQGADAFYVNVDGAPTGPEMLWDVPAESASHFGPLLVNWKGNVSPESPTPRKVFKLAPGEHQLFFVGRSAGTKLAGVKVLKIPAAPGELRLGQGPAAEPQRPAPPTGLRIVGGPN